MPSAQDHVLSTPEVLEAILIHLPLKDLLINAQRVSRLFHDVISSSHSLQQALFFRPIPASGPSAPTAALMNPLLQKKFPPWFGDKFLMAQTFALSDYKHFRELDWNGSSERRDAYARKGASWRRMLVSQPPAREIVVKKRVEARSGPTQSRGELKPKDGLRMGLFYDIVEDFVESQPVTYFVVQWHLPTVFDSESSDDSGHITIHLREVIQCRRGMTSKIGADFRSQASKPVNIDYIPEPRADRLLFLHS